jgi:glyoxylase I family protein
MNTFPAVSHVAVTVSDLSASMAWYRRLLRSDPVLDEDTGPFRHVIFALSGGMLFGLHSFPQDSPAAHSDAPAFDERRVGLDHVSFACADRAGLADWEARLDGLNIAHSPIVDAHYGSGLSFRDPDHIALEFFAPPA